MKWTFADKEFDVTFGNVALGNGTLYAIGRHGIFVCLDPRTGKELWRKDLGGDAMWCNSPVVSDGKVFVGAEKTLWVFEDAPKIKEIGQHKFKRWVTGTPTFGWSLWASGHRR